MIYFLIFLLVVCDVRAVLYYDAYYGVPIGPETLKRHIQANTTFWCVTEVEPCDPNEGRRVDGTCNNLKYPSRGASHTPFRRVLSSDFDENNEPKKSVWGNNKPLPRYVRTRLVSAGKVPSLVFTQLAIHFSTFMAADLISLHDTINYVLWKPYCCTSKGKLDSMCIPNKIPLDDPVHRFSGNRCLNLTKPETFQSVGCLPKDTTPERIMSATPVLDLSIVYGNYEKDLAEKGRMYVKGLLRYEVENDKIWPPSVKTKSNLCLINQPPAETRCHATPEDGSNSLASVNLGTIWFWRNHNFIATQLGHLNPCWNDKDLFTTARDINIASALQMHYYEWMPIFLGYDNLVKDGVMSPSGGFRDEYDATVMPELSHEYLLSLRWMHTIQEGTLKMYDSHGYYLKQFPIVNLTLRTGYFALDDNMEGITQGAFRQGGANSDYIADPDITELGLGPLQKITDLMTSDLAKNRRLGLQPYINYRKFCFGDSISSFDDLLPYIDAERVEILRDVYESVLDIDLLAGIWVEKPIYGGFVPPTLYCLVTEQLKRYVVSDRHWYERPNRPNAFTSQQLAEIRKVNIARFICDIGDKVTHIQPRAFLRAGHYNEIRSCNDIPGIDFTAWADESCKQSSSGDNDNDLLELLKKN